MPADSYENIVLEPPLEDWGRLLTDRRWQADDISLVQLRTSARRRLVESAEHYVLRLHRVAAESGLATGPTPVLTGDPAEKRLVMTGHQPVIFHSGLVFKYNTTQQFAADLGAIAVAVVIDSDEGDAGSFPFPVPDPAITAAHHASALPQLMAETATFSRSSGLYSHSQLAEPAQILAVRDTVTRQLRHCRQSAAANSFDMVAQQYASLKTASTVEANLIMRWQYGIGSQMLELPLSAICCFPEVLTLMAGVLSRPDEFAGLYNQQLSEFRAAQNIRNPANPFPDLSRTDGVQELPFWLVDDQSGRREIAVARVTGQTVQLGTSDRTIAELPRPVTVESLETLIAARTQLIPRGALITALLRILFSDLFVHGTGGGRYDRFTDRLIRLWWQTEPGPFAVASASRYLLREERQELQRLQNINKQLRDLTFNPQRYFGTDVFPPTLESHLQRLTQEKASAVADMQKAHVGGQSARATGQVIQQLTDEIRRAVGQEFAKQLNALQNLSDVHLATLNNRTWPWFCFLPVTPSTAGPRPVSVSPSGF